MLAGGGLVKKCLKSRNAGSEPDNAADGCEVSFVRTSAVSWLVVARFGAACNQFLFASGHPFSVVYLAGEPSPKKVGTRALLGDLIIKSRK